jgi:hypothetical protein
MNGGGGRSPGGSGRRTSAGGPGLRELAGDARRALLLLGPRDGRRQLLALGFQLAGRLLRRSLLLWRRRGGAPKQRRGKQRAGDRAGSAAALQRAA